MSSFGVFHRILLPALSVAEASLLVAAVFGGVWLRFHAMGVSPDPGLVPILPKALVFAAVVMVALSSTGLYNPRLRDALAGSVVRILIAFVMAFILLGMIFYAFPAVFIGRGAFALSLVLSFAGLVVIRAGYAAVLGRSQIRRNTLVLGAGPRASHLPRFRRKTDFMGVDIVGYVPIVPESVQVPEQSLVEPDRPLAAFAAAHGIDLIVVASDQGQRELIRDQLLECRTNGIEVVDLVTFIEREIGLLKIDVMDPEWLIFAPGFNRRVLRLWVKRLFDVAVSLVLLVVTLPLMLLTAAAIWLENGGRGPILYRQMRVGQEGVPFELLKFRSMRTDAEADGKARWAQAGDLRTTRIGHFLRRYRIDELPQLLNVLAGKMSFVGPRPERPQFVESLNTQIPYYAERHRVKPGLTGWAQICYPYGASVGDAFEKLQYDLYYAKNHNLLLDLMILFQTGEVVFMGKGAR